MQKNQNNERILILGSNSFGASSVIEKFLLFGHELLGVSRSPLNDPEFNRYVSNSNSNLNLKKYNFFQYDLNSDLEKLELKLKLFNPSLVIDFAGQGMVSESWQNPEQWYQTNIVSKVKLYKFMFENLKIKKYIKISTPEVYGSSNNILTTNSTHSPSTPYALSHSTIDKHIKLWNQQFNFPVIIGRFSNFYGAGQQLYRIIPKSFVTFLKGGILPIHGNGMSQRSFIHSQDIASGIEAMIANGVIGQVYHFSTGEVITIKDLIRMISKEVGVDMIKHTYYAEDRIGKDDKYILDSSKSFSELGWQPSISLEYGLKEVGNWVVRNFGKFSTFPLEYIHEK